ncbi:MAG: magnesium transporter CorA family protein [Solirubrobacterales bacterium]|nr:magnesium transporter CorA family protein [Solirubrobacterales bacterium]
MRILSALDTAAIGELRDRGEFFWLDLHTADDAVVEHLGRLFGFNELALEDSREFGQRPKVDDYGDHVLIVFFGVEAGEPVEVHCYVTGETVITLRRGHCSTLSAAHDRLGRVDARSEEEAVYRVLDSLTDSYFPALEAMGREIDDLEEEASESSDPEVRTRIFAMRKRLVALRRVVGPQRDMFTAAGGVIDRVPGLDVDRAHDFFRDIHDHLLQIADIIDTNRELLTGALDLHASAINQRVNQVTKQLTLIATIFLPLTFVTGFFGQNFGWMVDGIDTATDFLAFGVGGLVAASAMLIFYFVRSGFFAD